MNPLPAHYHHRSFAIAPRPRHKFTLQKACPPLLLLFLLHKTLRRPPILRLDTLLLVSDHYLFIERKTTADLQLRHRSTTLSLRSHLHLRQIGRAALRLRHEGVLRRRHDPMGPGQEAGTKTLCVRNHLHLRQIGGAAPRSRPEGVLHKCHHPMDLDQGAGTNGPRDLEETIHNRPR